MSANTFSSCTVETATNISLPCVILTGLAVVNLLVKDCFDIQSPLEADIVEGPLKWCHSAVAITTSLFFALFVPSSKELC